MTATTASLTTWLLEQIALEEDGRVRSLRDLAEAMRLRGDVLVADFLDEESARVLATCAAHRAIVEIHEEIEEAYPPPRDGSPRPHCCSECSATGEYPGGWPCDTLAALASIYADKPGFREEWAL
jgi:hypothetical protein